MDDRLSRKFLADLRKVYATLRPPSPLAEFLADLKRVYSSLPIASDSTLLFLASRFDKWRRLTQALVRARYQRLSADDPLRCPISLFRPKGYGRLETAHTRTLAWLLQPE